MNQTAKLFLVLLFFFTITNSRVITFSESIREETIKQGEELEIIINQKAEKDFDWHLEVNDDKGYKLVKELHEYKDANKSQIISTFKIVGEKVGKSYANFSFRKSDSNWFFNRDTKETKKLLVVVKSN